HDHGTGRVARSAVAAGDAALLFVGQALGLLAPRIALGDVVRGDLVVRLGRVADRRLVVRRHRPERLVRLFGVTVYLRSLGVLGHNAPLPLAGAVEMCENLSPND